MFIPEKHEMPIKRPSLRPTVVFRFFKRLRITIIIIKDNCQFLCNGKVKCLGTYHNPVHWVSVPHLRFLSRLSLRVQQCQATIITPHSSQPTAPPRTHSEQPPCQQTTRS